jgi:hypothetical protein
MNGTYDENAQQSCRVPIRPKTPPPPYLIEHSRIFFQNRWYNRSQNIGPIAVVQQRFLEPGSLYLAVCYRNGVLMVKGAEESHQDTFYAPCATCQRLHEYLERNGHPVFIALPCPSRTSSSRMSLSYLISLCQTHIRGKITEFASTNASQLSLTTRLLLKWPQISCAADKAFSHDYHEHVDARCQTIEELAVECVEHEYIAANSVFKLSSGFDLTWHQLNKIRNHSRRRGDNNSLKSQLYGTWGQPNRNGLSEWHSCVVLLALDDRLILREENQLTLSGQNDRNIDKDVQFCPHYKGSWLRSMLRSVTTYLGKPRLSSEDTWKCALCGTEFCTLLIDRSETDFHFVCWRYVDLGNMDDPDSPEWKRVTSDEGEEDDWRLTRVPMKVEGVYGPIMDLWSQELGIVYHFDRRAVAWLSKDGEELVQRTYA